MEITQQTITWAINGVFAFFIIMGFLFGAARGFKKSSLRLTFILAITALMYFASPYISKWLLTLDISNMVGTLTVNIGGTPHNVTTANNLLTTLINSNQALQDFVTANPSFTTLVNQLPLILANFVVFISGFYILKTISWPMYAIMSHNYNKRREDGSKPKKRSLAGGFMGTIQGVVIALIVFLPVAGVSSMLNVESTNGSGSTLLGSFVPEEVTAYFPSYENSALCMVGRVGNVSNNMFDGLSSIKVTNQESGRTITISPRQEVTSGMQIANDIQLLIDMVEGIENGTVTSIDWDLLENTINKVFTLNSLDLMIEEYAPYIDDEIANNPDYGVSDGIDNLPVREDVRNFLDEFLLNIDESTIEGFKSDALAFVGVGRALDEYGVVDLYLQQARQEISQEDMLDQSLQILAQNRELSEDIVNATLSSHTVTTLMPEAINIALGYIEHGINQNRLPENVSLINRINVDQINWDLEAQFLTDIMYHSFSFVNSVDTFNTQVSNELQLLQSLELTRLGEVINITRSTQLFGGVYTSLTEAILSMPEIKNQAEEYINLDELVNVINTTDWVSEFDTVEDMIDLFVLIEQNGTLSASQVESTIERLDSDLLELVIDGAVRAVLIEGFNENIGEYNTQNEFVLYTEFAWVGDINLNSISENANFFAQLIEFSFNVGNNGIESLTDQDIQDLVTSIESINTSLPAQELAEFKNFFNEFIHYTLSQTNQDLTWTQQLNIDDFIDNVGLIGEVFKLALAVEEDTITNYTVTEVEALTAEIAQLDNMSPELAQVLQGFYNEFMAESSPIFVPLDLDLINYSQEAVLIKDALNLYLIYENNGSFHNMLASSLVSNMGSSYVVVELLDAVVIELINDETTPTWVENADITWINNNQGLVVELLELLLWTQDNDISNISQAQIDGLQIEVSAINEYSQPLTDFKAYMQNFVNSL